ncbi:MAG TPA: PQQ-binding-like beta-propeller repeat protein, partial [Actinotalea sp.]|nr:PQQ-binding-like beta-propeller repeat protein [Actinotalea sp.]
WSAFAWDLTVPRHELWTAAGVYPIGLVGDLLLTRTDDGEGVQAFALADGTPVWSSAAGTCQVVGLAASDGGRGSWWGVGALTPDRARVLCDSWGQDGTVATTVLDPADGRELLTIQGGGPEVWTFTSGEYYVLADGTAGSRALTTWSLASGSRLWTMALDRTVYDIVMTSSQVLVPSPDGLLAFDLETGEAGDAETDPSERPDSSFPLSDGGSVENHYARSGVAEVDVLAPDGEVRWTVRGWAQEAWMGNGHDGGVVVVNDASLNRTRGFDAVTGRELWSREGRAEVVLRARGVLLLVTTDLLSSTYDPQLAVVDQRTGAELWLPELGGQAGWSVPVTDGTTLAFVARSDETRLQVRDLVTGEDVTSWSLPTDGDSVVLQLSGRLLAQIGTGGTTVLGP